MKGLEFRRIASNRLRVKHILADNPRIFGQMLHIIAPHLAAKPQNKPRCGKTSLAAIHPPAMSYTKDIASGRSGMPPREECHGAVQ